MQYELRSQVETGQTIKYVITPACSQPAGGENYRSKFLAPLAAQVRQNRSLRSLIRWLCLKI
jgi:hypothetical protein